MDISTVTELANSQFHVWLQSQLTNNSMLIAGMGTVILSGAMYALKSIPGKIWNAVYKRSTVTVTIFSDNENFVDIVTELNKNAINFLSRQNILDGDKMSVGLGISWTRFRGQLLKVSRNKEKSDSKEFKQEVELTAFFTSKKKIKQLFDDFITEKNSVNKDKTKVYSLNKDWIQHLKDIPRRSRDSVFVDPSILDHIEKRIKFFQNNRKWYDDRGIPYKYALLLHGVPGTGKTTLAKYIAGITGRNVVMVSPSRLPGLAVALNNNHHYDDDTSSKVGYVAIMEDVDTDNVTAKRSNNVIETEEDDYQDSVQETAGGKFSLVSLADLLNAIDGINSPEDFILVATTNHLTKLDPALFRKGRFDDVIEITPLETGEIIRMVKFFFETEELRNLSEKYAPIPGAVLQDIILQYFDEGPDKVIEVLNKEYGIGGIQEIRGNRISG